MDTTAQMVSGLVTRTVPADRQSPTPRFTHKNPHTNLAAVRRRMQVVYRSYATDPAARLEYAALEQLETKFSDQLALS